MNKVSLNSYLFFDGNCVEAMEFYKNVFGGDLTVQKYAEAPGDIDESMKNKVMHAFLETSYFSFMASDSREEGINVGTNVHLCISGTARDEILGYYNKLKEGGTEISPIEKQFWGDEFGALTDKFGISWMFNISAA